MGDIAEATLTDGRKIPYVIKDNPPRGGMKYTYFAPDKSYVVQFFNSPETANDPNVRKRLEAIIGKYNPTLSEQAGGARGNSEQMANYRRLLNHSLSLVLFARLILPIFSSRRTLRICWICRVGTSVALGLPPAHAVICVWRRLAIFAQCCKCRFLWLVQLDVCIRLVWLILICLVIMY